MRVAILSEIPARMVWGFARGIEGKVISFVIEPGAKVRCGFVSRRTIDWQLFMTQWLPRNDQISDFNQNVFLV